MTHMTLAPGASLRVKNWGDHSQVHRAVMGHFGELTGEKDERRAASNILYRVEETPRGKSVLISSDIAPEADKLGEGTQTKSVEFPILETGVLVRFRLAANAIQRISGGGTRPAADIDEWVAGKLSIALKDLTITTHSRDVGRNGQSALQVDVVDGVAEVIDGVALNELRRIGVGRSKAFGCGLLTITRL